MTDTTRGRARSRPAGGRLAGLTVVATGAGSGIGRAVAVECAHEGARVAVLDLSGSAAQETVELARSAGGDAIDVALDITDADAVQAAVQLVERRWNGVHGLFNNAAIALRPGDGTVVDLDWSAWDRTIAVNLTGAALVLRHTIPSMIRSGGGSIVNNVSIAALVAEDGLDAYTASKGGLLALSRSVAASFAADGVRCNAVCPGLVQTPLAAAVLPEFAQRMQQHTLLPIPGPEAIAPLVVYLLAEESRYVTGSTFTIDGGYSAR